APSRRRAARLAAGPGGRALRAHAPRRSQTQRRRPRPRARLFARSPRAAISSGAWHRSLNLDRPRTHPPRPRPAGRPAPQHRRGRLGLRLQRAVLLHPRLPPPRRRHPARPPLAIDRPGLTRFPASVRARLCSDFGFIAMLTASEITAALPAQARTVIDGLPFPRIASGKVREIFDLGDALLLVASDRLSAFDVILPDGIPGKGILLNQISLWWFDRTTGIIDNHLLPDQAGEFARRGITDRDLQLRSMIVRKLTPLTIECVVRGYLVGSGWASYKKSGEVCGHVLPAGLRQADKLPSPLFTPTTKAPKGEHDAPINDAQGAAAVGAELYEKVKATSIALYSLGHDAAARAGMILADT